MTSHDTHVLNELTDDRVVKEVDVGPLNSLAHILVLLLSQDKLNEHLLQLLIAVVDEELLKVVVLWVGRGREARREGGSGKGDRVGGGGREGVGREIEWEGVGGKEGGREGGRKAGLVMDGGREGGWE